MPVTTREPSGTTTRAPTTGARESVRHAVGQQIELGNGNGDADEQGSGAQTAQELSSELQTSDCELSSFLTSFMSSHTSRFDEGLRSR